MILGLAADDVIVGLIQPEGFARGAEDFVGCPGAGSFDALEELRQIITT